MKVQVAVQDGWIIDPDDAEGYPQAHTGFYRCTMHRQEKIAALLMPPVLPVPPAATEEPMVVTPEFKPSVFFTLQEEPQVVKRSAGRPKISMI